MIEIKCMKDIHNLSGAVDGELIALLKQDLQTIKDFNDEDEEYSMEEYNTDYSGNGYIVILEGNESDTVIRDDLGLSEGLEKVMPEGANNYFINGDKWTRIVVIYNDSYGMIIWLKNTDQFDDYVVGSVDGVDKKVPF